VTRARLLASAAALLLAYVLLGASVSSTPPGPVDRAGAVFFGHGVPAAIALTRFGLFPVYAALCVVLLLFALVRRAWLLRVVVSIAALLAAWQASDLFKAVFHRPRPEHWIVFHETSYAYSSGHATLSLAFYGLWAVFIVRSDLPRGARVAMAGALVALILAIGWSRLALGAHYVTDLVGGYDLGGAFLCAALALVATRGALARRS
jgi:membrane-associated phospholipid phosphatase